jgi:hydroxymethylbilane synthase
MSRKGVFTEELESALRSGGIDVAVHSLKDLPIDDTPDLTLGAICERDDAHDVLVSRERWRLATLPRGARVGTCSLRRTAQVLAARPDLNLLPLRGNVDTRVRKALNGEYDAIVLAAAGLLRLGLGEHISETLPFEVMLPAPGQAALAVQCRAADVDVLNLLAAIDHAPTRAAVTAERSFLAALGGGCSAPVAAYAAFSHPADARSGVEEGLGLAGLVASPDGRRRVRASGYGADPVALGRALAQQALAQGAGHILAQ